MQPACHWIDYADMSCLEWNAMCIATVKPKGERFEVRITWRGVTHVGPPCTRAQGRRFVERWVSARSGFPKDRKQKGTGWPLREPNRSLHAPLT